MKVIRIKVDDEFWEILKPLLSKTQEIVRCKDCKHWFYFWESENHRCTESDKHPWDCPIREEDDFCSRGEKKDD